MSHRAVDMAFQISLPHLQKHVLMALAYRHNHLTGQCDPAMETIAQDCGMSKSSVKAALRSLQALGLIEATQRKDGRVHISNFYTLNFMTKVGQDTTGVGQDTPHPGQDTTEGRAPQDPGVGQDTPPKGEVERGIESGNERKTTPDGVKLVLPDYLDLDLWNDYLEVRRKKRSVMSIRALNGILSRLADFQSQGHDAREILARSVRGNWIDVYEPKENKGGSNGATGVNFWSGSKTAGNINSNAAAVALFEQEEQNLATADEFQPASGGAGDSGDVSNLRPRLIDLRTG